MYKVYKSPSFGNPYECESWLNKLQTEDGLSLVACDGGYYIFESRPTVMQGVDWAKPGSELTVKTYWKDGKLVDERDIPPRS